MRIIKHANAHKHAEYKESKVNYKQQCWHTFSFLVAETFDFGQFGEKLAVGF